MAVPSEENIGSRRNKASIRRPVARRRREGLARSRSSRLAEGGSDVQETVGNSCPLVARIGCPLGGSPTGDIALGSKQVFLTEVPIRKIA